MAKKKAKKTTRRPRSSGTPGSDLAQDDCADDVDIALPQVAVVRQFLRGGRVLAEEVEDYEPDEIPRIMARVFPPGVPHTRVGLSVSQQWNLGSDSLVSTTIICTTPCLQEEASDAFTWADRFVTERLQSEDKKITKLQEKRRGNS